MTREPADASHDGPSEDHADDGRNHEKDDHRNPAFDQNDFEARLRDGRTSVAADDGVGGACGQRHEPGDDIPDDGTDQTAADYIHINGFWINQLVADGLGDARAEEEGGDKVEKRSPKDSLQR